MVHWYPTWHPHLSLPRITFSYLLAQGKHFLMKEEANPLTFVMGECFSNGTVVSGKNANVLGRDNIERCKFTHQKYKATLIKL